MPALSNIRRELFCRNMLKGMSRPKAYERAGYAAPCRQSAYRLAKEPDVAKRMFELLTKTETEVIITTQTLTNAYVEVLDKSFEDEDYKNAKSTLDSLAKLHGLMVDRKEVGKAGDFSKMTDDELRLYIENTAAEIGGLLLSPEGDEEEGPSQGTGE